MKTYTQRIPIVLSIDEHSLKDSFESLPLSAFLRRCAAVPWEVPVTCLIAKCEN